jgi:hypothetical protein
MLFGRELLRFRFMSIGLAKLKAKEYVEKSPLAAALAALMNRRRVRDRLQLRADMLRQIAKSRLDEEKKFLLGTIVETYFELDEDETEDYRQFLSIKGYREVEKMEVTWADKMMEKGRVEGREEGLKDGELKGKRETLMRLLTAKFGSVSEKTKSRVQTVESADELDAYLERVLTADSIAEMGL